MNINTYQMNIGTYRTFTQHDARTALPESCGFPHAARLPDWPCKPQPSDCSQSKGALTQRALGIVSWYTAEEPPPSR
jgi:hypothetical protein